MRFGSTSLADAESAILAHGFRLPGRILKKGRTLTAEDVAALRDAGYRSVVTARPDSGDVAENDAARTLAEALANGGAGDDPSPAGGGSGLVTGNAFTGRCNLLAGVRGVLCVDEEGVTAVNAVGEELTLATLSPLTVVDPRRLVATVKVIPFAIPRAHLDECLRLVRSRRGIVRVAPFLARRAGLVQTVLPGTRASILDKTSAVLREKLAGIGAGLEAEHRCAHTVDAVACALRGIVSGGCDLVVVLGASAIVDRRDVVPAAIEAAGGTVHRLGLPVDPGNLCLHAGFGAESGVAGIDAIPVIGLPGSSRSPAPSGADLLLRRIGAGLPLTARDFAGWGAGGLLKEQLGRPSPRSAAGDDLPGRASAGRDIAVMVLAAGQSRRMGRRNKLLEAVDGEPMVRHAVRAAAAVAEGERRVVVVTGHERAVVEEALAGFDAAFVHNPDFGAGLSTSLARGVATLPKEVEGVIVCLGDMPAVRAEHLERLREAFDPEAGAAICVATHRGKRGNPVLFASRFFSQMCEVDGDVGARHLIGAYADLVREVEMPDDAVLLDIDSPSALRSYRANGRRGERPDGEGAGA